MKPLQSLGLIAGALALSGHPLMASTVYGDINNFDVFNDTGGDCHGFEIEIDGIHQSDITYTFDWNHYAFPDPSISSNTTPKITEDNSDPFKPKVYVRYESTQKTDGIWSYTAPASSPTVTDGHMCTDPTQNIGCEHFGVGYYGSPTAIKYHWLIKDGSGNLIQGPAVNVATPTWVPYAAPAVPAAPGDPVIQVQAVIQAPPPPPPAERIPGYEFGDAVWVKEIKTTTHNNNNIELEDLVSFDNEHDANGLNGKDWKNAEPDEVEVEWQIMQTEFNKVDGGANGELAAEAEDLPGNDETVTRRWEFYKYTGPLDSETNEALCDKYPSVIDPANPSYKSDCDPTQIGYDIKGDYIGAQMAAFDPEAGLGLVNNLQDGDVDHPYERRVVIGGTSPYTIDISSGALPPGIAFEADPDDVTKSTGILKGTTKQGDTYSFGITVVDAQGTIVNTPSDYTLKIADGAAQNHAPAANDNSASTNEDTVADINLSASDADNDNLTYTVVNNPAHGALSGVAPNLTYTPAANYNGSDSFTFKVNDGQTDSNTATATITVILVYDPPKAVADNTSTKKNTAVTIPVSTLLVNDINPDEASLSVTSAGSATKGRVSVTKTNKKITAITFKPKKNFIGAGSFSYTISDGKSTSSAIVTVTVNP